MSFVGAIVVRNRGDVDIPVDVGIEPFFVVLAGVGTGESTSAIDELCVDGDRVVLIRVRVGAEQPEIARAPWFG